MKLRTCVLNSIVAFVWVCFADSHFAFGQGGSSTTKIDVRSSMSMKSDKNGDVLVVIFKDGVPASGVALKTPRGVLTSNSEGVLSFSLPAGQDHKLEVVATGQDFKVNVVANEESQVIINLLVDKTSDVAVEAPKAKTATVIDENAPRRPVNFKVATAGGEALPEATILFSGVDAIYKTDNQGRVTTDLPEGTYSATVFHPQFQTHTISEFTVGESQNADFSIGLKPAQNELEDVVVLAPKIKGSLSALVEVRKQSSSVTDVLGAEQMARAGDGDAGASLRRVTGLTLVGGKYVYVRGLGERYSSVQMNSFSLPSPEPTRRVVPLDLFPTAIMESIVVQKSYSPDLPGEFGGGLIQLKTRSLPEKFFFRGSISNVFENTGNQLDHQGGSTDWLGMDDGTRALPQQIKQNLAAGKKLSENVPGFTGGVSQQELIDMGRSLTENYNFTRDSSPSLPGLSLSMGSGWKVGNTKLGLSGSTLYGQSTDVLERTTRAYIGGAGGKLELDSRRDAELTELETRLAGSLDLGVEVAKDHKFVASNFVLRNTTKLSQFDTRSAGSVPDVETTTLDFIERQLWTRHLKGEHDLKRLTGLPLVVDWRVGSANATRDNPDRRETSYLAREEGKSLLNGQSGNRRTWSNLEDVTREQAINLTVPIRNSFREYLKFKVGAMAIDKKRDSSITRLYLDDQSNGGGIADTSNANIALGDANIGPTGFMLKNTSADQADNYGGTQTINAFYGMFEVSPWEQLSFQAGTRRETSSQLVNTYNYLTPGVPTSISSIKMEDLLPAYGVVWKPTEKIRARIAYSETVARPDFREMATVGFIDDETGYLVIGNANLKGTVIRNIDHRWEYYFNSDEYASIGVFYKEFTDPIESIFIPGANRIQTFENAKAANNYGVEVEGRVGLRHFSRYLRRWTVLSNVTYIESEIELNDANKGIQTSSARPLQGQSPYAINMQLQYDRPQWGFSGAVLYNIVGKRITEVGTNGIPDSYEQPFGQLDFVMSKQLQANWTVSLRGRNLLNPNIETTQDESVVREFRRNRSFGLVLGAVF